MRPQAHVLPRSRSPHPRLGLRRRGKTTPGDPHESLKPLNNGQGSVFGDGLRCGTGIVIRLGIKSNQAGASRYPEPSDQPISIRGLIPTGGNVTRIYQGWYRDAAPFCSPSGFNLTNGLSIAWAP